MSRSTTATVGFTVAIAEAAVAHPLSASIKTVVKKKVPKTPRCRLTCNVRAATER